MSVCNCNVRLEELVYDKTSQYNYSTWAFVGMSTNKLTMAKFMKM